MKYSKQLCQMLFSPGSAINPDMGILVALPFSDKNIHNVLVLIGVSKVVHQSLVR